MRYWLMKTEPDHVQRRGPRACQASHHAWDGVRNYQARNMLRDDMKKGDLAFLYYSSTDVPESSPS